MPVGEESLMDSLVVEMGALSESLMDFMKR